MNILQLSAFTSCDDDDGVRNRTSLTEDASEETLKADYESSAKLFVSVAMNMAF